MVGLLWYGRFALVWFGLIWLVWFGMLASTPNFSCLGSPEVSLKLFNLLVWTAGGRPASKRPAVGENKNKAKLRPAKLSLGLG